MTQQPPQQPPVQSIPDGSVVVTPTEMYREIRDMHDGLRS